MKKKSGKQKKPYNYSSKNRLKNTSSFPFKVGDFKDAKKNLENTLTKLHIVEEPPQEIEILDDGFLEGRVGKKENKKKKNTEKKKKKPAEKKNIQKKKNELDLSIIFSNYFFIFAIGICILLFTIFGVCYFVGNYSLKEKPEDHSNVIDDNYLFVGDFHTSNFSFQDFNLDYHYVNVGEDHLTTEYLLGNMKNKIYDYNPSVIFLEIGMIDIEEKVSKEDFLSHYSHILKLIQMNRPYAEVYVESIYPIDCYGEKEIFCVDNEKIKKYNVSLKALCKEMGVHYLDIYAVLMKDGKLNPLYTDDGVYLNKKGYQEILNIIKSVV